MRGRVPGPHVESLPVALVRVEGPKRLPLSCSLYDPGRRKASGGAAPRRLWHASVLGSR
jgi:hypothetical protein